MEIQQAGKRLPFLDDPAYAGVIQRSRPTEPPSQTLLCPDVVAGEDMETAKTS